MLTRVFLFFLTLQFTFALSAQEVENNSASQTTTQSEPVPATPDLSQYNEENGENKEWGPHIVDHLYKGCPTNALCSKETGETLDQLKNLLSKKYTLNELNQFKQKWGMPFEVWGLTSELKIQKTDAYHWQSQCQGHNLEGMKIYQSGLLIKNINDLTKLESSNQIQVRKGLLFNNPKSIVPIVIQRADAPLYFENQRPVFVQEFEGLFYGMRIEKNGDITLIDQSRPDKMPEVVSCPKELVQEYRNQKYPGNLYSGFYCQNIYDISTKKSMTLLIPRGCN